MKAKRDPQEAARRAEARAQEGKAKHRKPPKAAKVTFPPDELWRAVNEDEEIGLAQLGIKALQDRFVFDLHRGLFLEHKTGGGYFLEDAAGQVKRAFREAVKPHLERQRDAQAQEINRPDVTKEDRSRAEYIKKKYSQAIRRISTRASLENIAELMRTGRDSLAREGTLFDRDPWALHCLNCRIDLRTGQDREGRPSDMSTKYCDVTWRGLHYEHPSWNAYLESLLPADAAEYLQQFVGYSITGVQRKAFAILYSKFSDSGKTLFLETMKNVFGNYSGMLPSALLMDDRKGASLGPTPELAALQGLRLAFFSESGKGDHFKVDRLKWLTGGDTLVARGLYAKPISFEPSHTIYLASNHLGRIGIDEDAVWGRIHLFTFPFAFKERPAKPNERPINPELKEQLQQEDVKSAILAWAVRGCLSWQKNGQHFNPPLSCRKELETYRLNEDFVEAFVRACCEKGDEYREQAKPLHDAYTSWHESEFGANSKPLGRRKFSEVMSAKFQRQSDGKYHYYSGIRLKP